VLTKENFPVKLIVMFKDFSASITSINIIQTLVMITFLVDLN